MDKSADDCSSADPAGLAAVFWTGWEGAVLRAKLEAGPAPLRRFAAAFLEMIPKT
ncbi:TetR family transcriptional regulator C-terminal domain-containing protein [Mangrovicoccus ximenensis]|uniref:TetR family transcriptional regulator C-terminal domain-containing protein n=1 Tax=Mangrovicoccus ximenensis TaxID=1911570 RepID=UPI001F293B34|nr:TetR family transcriptional regulator C-terminal domain-containing protein [Mangrovicoccus ximenensis]